MTCVVGLEHRRKVYLAGDASLHEGGLVTLGAEPKVWRSGLYVVGFAGSMQGFAIRDWDPPTPPDRAGTALDRFMRCEFAESLRGLYERRGWDISEESYLVGARGRLYELSGSYVPVRTRHGYGAVGSGTWLALGALHALGADLTPRQRLEAALEAACAHSDGVRSPWSFAST